VPARRIVAAPDDNPLLHDLDPSLETAQGFHDRQQALVQRGRYRLVCRIGQDRHELADMLGSFGHHNAKLGHQPAQGVDQHGALLDQHLAHLVNARRCLLQLVLTVTKRIDGRLTASQIASASARSFLLRRTQALA
jgi:hypothetical protein